MNKHDEGGGASRTTDPASGSSTGTDVELRSFVAVIVEALDRRTSELRAADHRFEAERDRRYAELAIEREKALKIKEEADKRALDLQAETQAYKDEKANELREQINSERGRYLARDEYLAQHKALEDKFDAQLKPLSDYITRQQGRNSGISSIAAAIFAVAVVLINIALYYATHH